MDAEATKSATDIGEGVVTERPDAQTSAGPSRKKKDPTPLLPEIDVPLYEKDLIRMLAEVHFIYGEVKSFLTLVLLMAKLVNAK